MKLYWSSRSPFVRKVMIAAHETGHAERLELSRVSVGFARLDAEVMCVNPLNRIPTLKADDGSVLFDSRVICEFFDKASGRPSLYLGTEERPRVLAWQTVGDGIAEIAILWNNERNRPETLRSTPHLEAYCEKIEAALDWLEHCAESLSDTPFNMGAIAVGSALSYLDFRFSEVAWRERRPVLAAWFERFDARPSVRMTAHADVF